MPRGPMGPWAHSFVRLRLGFRFRFLAGFVVLCNAFTDISQNELSEICCDIVLNQQNHAKNLNT